MIKKPPETYRAFLDRLEDLFDQSPPENAKDAEEELRDAGLDPELVGQRIEGYCGTDSHSVARELVD